MPEKDKDFNDLVKCKAEELLRKKKTQELNSALFNMVKVLPKSLDELHSAMEMLHKEINSSTEINKDTLKQILGQYEKFNKDLNNLYDKMKNVRQEDGKDIEKLNWNLIDKNNPNSFILQIEEMFRNSREELTDLNNDKSLANTIQGLFEEVLERLQKDRNIRDIITWVLTSGLTAVLIIRWLIEFTSN